ncbi:hypothetical protein PUV54_15635 [Hyphococcus flavus]|uniref:DUF3106 domain-containing protein n=1 Tax=Hyphococcus flavus TaxID=1866326 RepID=A0AAE9ZBV0_9PROT|nr:hypothetical protein [Hyphococcus flavus]WDI31381.1 hypothetical protein PUV54_15635 [Hyphococcus flavus]
MRTSVDLLMLACCATLLAVSSANAEDLTGPAHHKVSVVALDPFVDLMAADFYEDRLRLSQSRRIEAETARQYLALSSRDRARFRNARKELWRKMSKAEKATLRNAKLPQFTNLTEAQKQPFREIASRELGAATLLPVLPSQEDEI